MGEPGNDPWVKIAAVKIVALNNIRLIRRQINEPVRSRIVEIFYSEARI
jgi:hypothetical protein